MKTRNSLRTLTLATGLLLALSVHAGDGEVTIIHTGDFHGHLIARANVRSDAHGKHLEGGLARVYTKIQDLRKHHPNALLIHTGDTIQGSAEVLYTRGDAIVDIVNKFGIDAFAPGNWEFVYGTQRFIELFGPNSPKAPWNSIAANVFYDGEPYADKTGQRVLPPYVIKQVGQVKVGILGLTTDRGPQVVGKSVTRGFRFLKNTAEELDTEVEKQVRHLREAEKVDLLIMASEMGLANNIRLAEKIPGIDAVLSADMHEESMKPVITRHGTVVIEEGQDGTLIGELQFTVKSGKVARHKFKPYVIDDTIPENKEIAAMVAAARKTFVAGPSFTPHVNPINGSKLARPIDSVVGNTAVALHRSNFSHEKMPAVIEGSSHDFLTDAFRAQTGAQIGAIRGFRYGTHVPVGPMRYEDLYHFLPIGPQIATGKIQGKQLKAQIESAADGSLNPDVAKWTGGWLFNFSNVSMDIDPYQPAGARASKIKVGGQPLDPEAEYTYASYWYAVDPDLINVVPAKDIVVLKGANGETLDATEVVARYLESLPDKTARPELNRIKLVKPLPKARYGFPEVQPLGGVK